MVGMTMIYFIPRFFTTELYTNRQLKLLYSVHDIYCCPLLY